MPSVEQSANGAFEQARIAPLLADQLLAELAQPARDAGARRLQLQRNAGVLAFADGGVVVGQGQRAFAAQGLDDVARADRRGFLVAVDHHLDAPGLHPEVIAQDAPQPRGVLQMADALLQHQVDAIGLFQGDAGQVVDVPRQVDHCPVIAGARQVEQRFELLQAHVLAQAQLAGAHAEHIQRRAEMVAEAVQRHAVEAVDALQDLHRAVRGVNVERVGDAAELQVHVQQQGPATLHAELVRQVAGDQRRAGTALGVDHRHQPSAFGRAAACLGHLPQQRRTQLARRDRLGEKIPCPGLHRQAHRLTVVQRPADQQCGALATLALQQRAQLVAPQLAEMQHQHVRQRVDVVQRIGMTVADQAGRHTVVRQALHHAPETGERIGVAPAEQQLQGLRLGPGRGIAVDEFQHGVISGTSLGSGWRPRLSRGRIDSNTGRVSPVCMLGINRSKTKPSMRRRT